MQPSSGLVTCQVNANDRLFYLMDAMVCWPKLLSLFFVDWFSPLSSKSDFVSAPDWLFFCKQKTFLLTLALKSVCRLHQNSSISCILCCAKGRGRSWCAGSGHCQPAVGHSSLSPSSSETVRCSIDVTAAVPSLGPRGHCGVPHCDIGPFAGIVAWEQLGCAALEFVQSTCSCSAPAPLVPAAIQPAPHSHSPPKPFSSGMTPGSAAGLSCCCCQEVCRGESSCERPAPHLLQARSAQDRGGCSGLQGLGGAKAWLHPQQRVQPAKARYLLMGSPIPSGPGFSPAHTVTF